MGPSWDILELSWGVLGPANLGPPSNDSFRDPWGDKEGEYRGDTEWTSQPERPSGGGVLKDIVAILARLALVGWLAMEAFWTI